MCSLPEHFADLLIRLAQAGLVQAKWTDKILDEVFANLQANRPELDPARLTRTRELMMRAVRDCLVRDYEALETVVELPDPDDRHVLAAAIKSRAQLIVTNNLRDFPEDALTTWNVEAVSADDFVMAQIGLDRQRVFAAVQQIADSFGANRPVRRAMSSTVWNGMGSWSRSPRSELADSTPPFTSRDAVKPTNVCCVSPPDTGSRISRPIGQPAPRMADYRGCSVECRCCASPVGRTGSKSHSTRRPNCRKAALRRTYGNLPGSVSGVPTRHPVGFHPRRAVTARTPWLGKKSFGRSSLEGLRHARPRGSEENAVPSGSQSVTRDRTTE
jgi:predicted nucleic acid-binding protein